MRFSRRRQPQRLSAVAAWASVLLGLCLVLTSFVLAVQPTAATGGGQSNRRDVQIEKDWIGGNGTQVTITVTYTDEDGNQQQATRTCPANDGKCGDKIQDVKVGTTVTVSEPSLSGWWTDPASLSCTVTSGNGAKTCTVENHKLRDVQIKKKWDTDSGAGIGVPSGPVQLEIQSVLGSTTVTCNGTGTTWDCTPTVQAPAGTELTITEPSPPAGWAPRSSDLSFTVPTSGSGTATHAVENKPVTRKLEVKKQWLTNQPPNQDVQLQVTVDDPGSGSPKTYNLTCKKSNQSTWSCGSVSDVQVGSSVTVSEPNPPSGWQPVASTLSFTMPSGNGTYTHTVQNEPQTAGGGGGGNGGTKEIEIKKDHQNTTVSCPQGQQVEWHFVITQIDEESNAPSSITATFQNAGTVTITREKFTGGTAHYTYYTPGSDTLITATATIYEEWDGQFNLSHAECTGEPTTLKLRFKKVWQGGDPPASGTVTLTVKRDGNEIGTATCTGNSSTNPWTCAIQGDSAIEIQLGDELTITEEGVDETQWQVEEDTLTLTVDADFLEDHCDDGDCTHTVVNLRQYYEIELVKEWDGGDPPSAEDADGFELSAESGENAVVCTWNGTALVCNPATLTVEWGDTFTVTESGLPGGWQNQSGLGEIDPSTLQNCATSGLLITCTHTVVNRFQTEPSEEPERTLTLRKQWIGSGRPNSIVLEVTVGSETTEVTCSGSGSLWTCTPTIDLPAGDDVTVVIAEPDVPAGWRTTSGTGSFTVGQLCGNAEDCTHTVVNRREQEREENPPGTPEQPNQPNPPSGPPAPPAPPSPPPISEASPVTATPTPTAPAPQPSLTTPVSEAAPATATPPTRVSEASPIVGTPPPQVLPKTGRGDGGSGMLWLLTGLGSLLIAAGTGMELHRRSRRGTRA